MWSCSGAGIPGVSRGTQQIPAQGAQTQQGLPSCCCSPCHWQGLHLLHSHHPHQPNPLWGAEHTQHRHVISLCWHFSSSCFCCHTQWSLQIAAQHLGFQTAPISFRKPWGALQSIRCKFKVCMVWDAPPAPRKQRPRVAAQCFWLTHPIPSWRSGSHPAVDSIYLLFISYYDFCSKISNFIMSHRFYLSVPTYMHSPPRQTLWGSRSRSVPSPGMDPGLPKAVPLPPAVRALQGCLGKHTIPSATCTGNIFQLPHQQAPGIQLWANNILTV